MIADIRYPTKRIVDLSNEFKGYVILFKGLENENVVVYGLIPYNDDEARLCYVAATRAKHQLIWYFTIGRDKYKKKSRYSTRTWE